DRTVTGVQTCALPIFPNGLCWTFTATDGLLAEIGHLIDTERKCCRFMRFVIVVEAGGGQVSLDVTGPTGTREFLQRLTNPKAGEIGRASCRERVCMRG